MRGREKKLLCGTTLESNLAWFISTQNLKLSIHNYEGEGGGGGREREREKEGGRGREREGGKRNCLVVPHQSQN